MLYRSHFKNWWNYVRAVYLFCVCRFASRLAGLPAAGGRQLHTHHNFSVVIGMSCALSMVAFHVSAEPAGYGAWNGSSPTVVGHQAPADAANMVQSGTGFFVSNTGYLLTNEHVVHGCTDVTLRGTIDPSPAKVVAVDKERDLALIKTAVKPRRVANIRSTDENMMINDQVMVIGYPLDSGVSGQYKVARSTIIGLEGPRDEPFWIQFADSALQGNSGGPLLDSSGNVVGVVVGKTKLVSVDEKTGKQEVLKKADVAISLPYVKEFMHKNGVYFRNSDSQGYYSLDRVENQARDYIVNIHCKPATT